MDYQWVKALHLISVMSWMAGLLYLPRLFVMRKWKDGARAQIFTLVERPFESDYESSDDPCYIFGLWMLHLNPTLLQKDMDDHKVNRDCRDDVCTCEICKNCRGRARRRPR